LGVLQQRGGREAERLEKKGRECFAEGDILRAIGRGKEKY